MANKSAVSPSAGIASLVFCIAIFMVGYTVYLMQTHQHLDAQASALSPSWYHIKPTFMKKLVVEGGFIGTLSAVLLEAFNGLIYASGGFGLYYLCFRTESRTGPSTQSVSKKQAPLRNGENSSEIIGSDLMVMLPKYRLPATQEERGGAVDKNPYRQVFYRIARRMPKVAEGVEMTPHRALYVAVYAMLDAHADVPASIGTHHADATLRDHSLAVSQKVLSFFKEQKISEPLAAVAGLAHDLDKLLAYAKKGDGWAKNVNATHHNKYSAFIVSTQPEFRNLPPEDQNTLLIALRYYHDPANLPVGASRRIEMLIRALRYCDGYSIQQEKAAGVESVAAEGLELLDTALLNTISELNINCYISQEEHAGGWTTPALEYVLIPMSTMLEKIGKHLTVDLVRKLQLDHETRIFSHPAARLIGSRLANMHLLMGSYKNFTSEAGLYDCRIGNTRFKAVLMIEKRALASLLPGLEEKWGTAPYRIRITSSTEDHTVQGESDVEEKEKEA